MFEYFLRIRSCLTRGLLIVCTWWTLPGCVMRGNVDVLEAQLRSHETTLGQYEHQLSQLRNELVTSRNEVDILRTELAESGNRRLPQETSQSLARVQGIKFHGLLTASQNADDQPGDERFHAVVHPYDAHGATVKLSGDIELEAIDLSRPPADRTIGYWSFSNDQLRDVWHSGFLATGFQFDLPWMHPPHGTQVVLRAKLSTLDGRSFETSHTLHVEPPAISHLETPASELFAPPPIQQVGGEQPVRDDSGGVRKVPRPQPLNPTVTPRLSSAPAARRGLRSAQAVGKDDAPAPQQRVEANRAPPFPLVSDDLPANGLRTSDSWTEATIPQWR